MKDEEIDLRVAADIYRCLPGKNCGKKGKKSPCGQPLCGLFAKEILKGRKDPSICPYLDDDNLQNIVMILDKHYN